MDLWMKDFLAGLRAGKSPETCARQSAGMPLAVVHQFREQNEEFAAAWDEILQGNDNKESVSVASGRKLTAPALEAILWAQSTDKQAAAYFGMDEDEFIHNINNDEKLLVVYDTARDAGLATLRLRQYETAVGGNSSMLKHLGAQHLDQKKEDDVDPDKIKDDVLDTVKRIAMLFSQTGVSFPILDVKPEVLEPVQFLEHDEQ